MIYIVTVKKGYTLQLILYGKAKNPYQVMVEADIPIAIYTKRDSVAVDVLSALNPGARSALTALNDVTIRELGKCDTKLEEVSTHLDLDIKSHQLKIRTFKKRTNLRRIVLGGVE